MLKKEKRKKERKNHNKVGFVGFLSFNGMATFWGYLFPESYGRMTVVILSNRLQVEMKRS